MSLNTHLEVARVVLELQLLRGGRHEADKDNVAQARVGIGGVHKFEHRRSPNRGFDPLCSGAVVQLRVG